MAEFIGTSGNDEAKAAGTFTNLPNGALTGFSGGTLAELSDTLGDTFLGSDGNDTIASGIGDDSVSGGAGNDLFYSSDGSNTLDGGAGNDHYVLSFASNGTNQIIEDSGEGTDLVDTVNVNFSLAQVPNVENLSMYLLGDQCPANPIGVGNDLDNRISYGADLIPRTVTAVTLFGGAGNDTIVSGEGAILSVGSIIPDFMLGGPGDDLYVIILPHEIHVQEGQNEGIDTIQYNVPFTGNFATSLSHTLDANVENLIVEHQQPGLIGINGNELDNTITVVSLSNAFNEIDGAGGNDRIEAFAGRDSVGGGAGNDTLDGGGNLDWLTGGDGEDNLDGGDGGDDLNGGKGNDSVYGGVSAGQAPLDGGDTLHGGEGDDIVQGNGGADEVHGDAGQDTVGGGKGNDTVFGGGDNDVVKGGNGLDEVHGGAGDDSVYGGNATGANPTPEADTLFGDEGDDLVQGNGGDDEVHGGIGNDTVRGGKDNDQVFGEADDDFVKGGNGNDVLNGGTGNDTLTGGLDDDRFVFLDGDGIDNVVDFANNGLEKFDLTGLATGAQDFASLVLSDDPFGPGITVNYGTGNFVIANLDNTSDLDAGDFLF